MQVIRTRYKLMLSMSFCLLMSHANQVLASFTCGQHMKTYSVSVTSLGGNRGAGVRCLFSPIGTYEKDFVRYGEGTWGSSIYRHVGENSGGARSSAADLYGNGETTNGVFYESLQTK